MKQASRLLIAAVFALLLAACASAGKRNAAHGVTLPPPDTTAASGAYEGATDYRVGSQDLLEISVFGVKDLSHQARVNSNGMINLPLVGSVMAGGKTVPELERELGEKYADGYLQNPQVTVFVKEYTSQRVTLEGALKKPGIYPLTGKTSLLQAIAMAEGTDEFADLEGVVLFRNVEGQRMAAAYDLTKVRRGELADPQVYGDDIIVIERSGSKSAFREFIRSVPALGLFLAL
ncbi:MULTISPECIES: polysaccharide biosynthesis/export family protein [unclassified Luteimonas]|uniref:polysaccharide biosynthesis/export family protein n=1 Tax=unclassified Luteimonas TaxID=2629088 RepID=UPI0018F05FE0|nr:MULTISPECIES: polysaccharide biosynthesis/export family protein [unclassified Luteimonas]MBJ6978112.1 polysaccharide export protein [Luteimonas sp. MC1895]MBJ6984233.1 polysaccharide export protein [Luteimonas sp. MC1750]QQO06980.1 polysaccharide export protein [Luteimonas sp. MC1750]